jgi:hypothetical protein
VTIWVGRVLFMIMGVMWELITDSPFWVRLLNGVFAAIVLSLVFSKILESLCAHQKSPQQPAA